MCDIKIVANKWVHTEHLVLGETTCLYETPLCPTNVRFLVSSLSSRFTETYCRQSLFLVDYHTAWPLIREYARLRSVTQSYAISLCTGGHTLISNYLLKEIGKEVKLDSDLRKAFVIDKSKSVRVTCQYLSIMNVSYYFSQQFGRNL